MKGQKEKFEIYEQAIVEEQEQTVVATLTNDTVLRRTIPWDTMKSAKLISEGELAMIRKFDKRPAQEREDLLDKVSACGSSHPTFTAQCQLSELVDLHFPFIHSSFRYTSLRAGRPRVRRALPQPPLQPDCL
jgi:hypothetical protein